MNEGLSDTPSGALDYSMKQELDQVLRVGARVASCMAKCALCCEMQHHFCNPNNYIPSVS